MTDVRLLGLSETEFTHEVSLALRSYGRLLDLSRSPLAASSLVRPALVLDENTPTADDRGRALRVVLRWAIGRLAPAPALYPMGSHRPHDDPTWKSPLWRRYNILRHRYVEPIQRDEVREGIRPTDLLIELTGLAGPDSLADERNRAVRELASILREQIATRLRDHELRDVAADEICRSLEPRGSASDGHHTPLSLLGIAVTFKGMFPKALLNLLAAAEGWDSSSVSTQLRHLVSHHLLAQGDGQSNLLVPPALQQHLYPRQSEVDSVRRHIQAAEYYLSPQPNRAISTLDAAWHLQRAREWERAARLLLDQAGSLATEEPDAFRDALAVFSADVLSPAVWRDAQVCLGDVCTRLGARDDALAAYRHALAATTDARMQARIYHRLGKLYEEHSPLRALGYYRQAAERFGPDDPEYPAMLKDRGWLHIHRQQWAEAEHDLSTALALIDRCAEPADGRPVRDEIANQRARARADIADALASLHRQQKHFAQAADYALQALALREEMGDLQRVADSCNNLGLIYAEMGATDQAIATYQEAMATYEKLGNQEAIATARMNVGVALHLANRPAEAVTHYRASLELCRRVGLPRREAQALYNLAEALAGLGHIDAACRHWQDGYALSLKAGLPDQQTWFAALRHSTPALRDRLGECVDTPLPSSVRAGSAIGDTDGPTGQPSVENESGSELLPAELTALEIARQDGHVTARRLAEKAHISKPTATRHLARLARCGRLVKMGKGRGVCYRQPLRASAAD